jgi:hypothetical protein
MKDNRTVCRSFVKRLDAEQRWKQVYQRLLDLGLSQRGLIADGATATPGTARAGANEHRCVRPGTDSASS